MLLILAQLFVLFLGFLMFRVKMKQKLAILLFAAICLEAVTVRFIPFGGAKYFLSNCFLLSELPRIFRHLKLLKKTTLYALMVLMIVATIILIIFSPHYHTIFEMLRLVELELVGKYFIICYAFLCIQSEQDLRPSVKSCFWGMIILTAFGVLNLITKNGFWINEMTYGIENANQLTGDLYTDSARFRVQAMFASPFDYGVTCVIIGLFYYFVRLKKLVDKRRFIIVECCSLFGIVFCGCRTIVACALAGIFAFVVFTYPTRKWIKGTIATLALFLFALPFLPSAAIQEYIDKFVMAFSTDTSGFSYGSSLGMRLLQLATVLYYIREDYLFGRGKDFFSKDMGWGDDGRSSLVDKDMQGLEGVYLNLLLERGIVGFIFWFIFYFSLFFYVFFRRHNDKICAALFMAIFAVYMAYSNMTGELNIVFRSMLVMGITIKLLYLKSNIQS